MVCILFKICYNNCSMIYKRLRSPLDYMIRLYFFERKIGTMKNCKKIIAVKNCIKFLSTALLAVSLSACEVNVPDVSETADTAFENHTIMPKIVEAEAETERPATDFDEKDYDDNYIEKRSNDEYIYDVYEDHIVLKSYLEDKAVVEIPAEIDGLKVTEIGNIVFKNSSITSVNIPEGVEKIGYSAFGECSSLKDVVIPNGFEIYEFEWIFGGTPWYEENYGE